jgi:DNA-binding CsgD family transcriptional regulator
VRQKEGMDYQINGVSIPFSSDNLLAESLAAVAEDYKISPAEHQALLLVLSGRSIDDIAQMLNLKPVTVRKRLGEVYQKFGIYGAGPGKLAKLQHMLLTLSQTNTGSGYGNKSRYSGSSDQGEASRVRRGRAAERGGSYGTKSPSGAGNKGFTGKGGDANPPLWSAKKNEAPERLLDFRQLRINIPAQNLAGATDAPSADSETDPNGLGVISQNTKKLAEALVGQYDLMVIWGSFGSGKSYQMKQIADVLAYSAKTQWRRELLCWRYVCESKATVQEVYQAWQGWYQNLDPNGLLSESESGANAEDTSTQASAADKDGTDTDSGASGTAEDGATDYTHELINQWCSLSQQEPLLICLDDLPNTLEWQKFFQQWVAVTEKMLQAPKLCCTYAAKTTWLASLAASSARLYLWECEGIDLAMAQVCLAKWQLKGDLSHWQTLVDLYRGSPRHLRRTADLIGNLFNGQINEFLLLDEIYVDEATQQQLKEQISACEPVQLKLLAALAKSKTPLTLSQLTQTQTVGKLSVMERLNHLESLRWQNLIEVSRTSDSDSQTRYGLIPVVREVYQQVFAS